MAACVSGRSQGGAGRSGSESLMGRDGNEGSRNKSRTIHARHGARARSRAVLGASPRRRAWGVWAAPRRLARAEAARERAAVQRGTPTPADLLVGHHDHGMSLEDIAEH